MKKFEYHVVSATVEAEYRLEEKLNDFGKNGWELVVINPIDAGGRGFFTYIFKREKQSV